jgi:hypothetical protein
MAALPAVSAESRQLGPPPSGGIRGQLRGLLRCRWVQVTIVVWIAGNVAWGVLTSQSGFPFPFPNTPTALGYWLTNHVLGGLALPLALIAITIALTRHNAFPTAQFVSRAPERRRAAVETTCMVAYAVLAQVGGWAAGAILGIHSLSLHLPGTIFGLPSGQVVTTREVYIWSIYNFVMYALVPYTYFRLMRYSNQQLSLHSSNRRRDVTVIAVVLVLESAAELGFNHTIFSLSPTQLLEGAPLSFVVHLFGTVLPIMIFIYAILLPRYLRLTSSIPATVILGGVTYAAIHWFDPWAVWGTPSAAALSVLFLFFQYFAPGMVKAVLTLRTGNAWVHTIAYHAIAPHVTLDTPNIVRIFGIR